MSATVPVQCFNRPRFCEFVGAVNLAVSASQYEGCKLKYSTGLIYKSLSFVPFAQNGIKVVKMLTHKQLRQKILQMHDTSKIDRYRIQRLFHRYGKSSFKR